MRIKWRENIRTETRENSTVSWRKRGNINDKTEKGKEDRGEGLKHEMSRKKSGRRG
jgi:hypothetical protein